MKSVLFSLAMMISTTSFAHENPCAAWLQASRFGRVMHADAADRNNVDALVQAFQDFRLSSHRGTSENYSLLISKISDLKQILEDHIKFKKALLKSQTEIYKEKFGPLARWTGWGEAGVFYKLQINPHKKAIVNLQADIRVLEEIKLQAGLDRSYSHASRPAHEARLTFLATKRELGNEVAFLLARSLVGYQFELRRQIEIAKNLIEHLSGKYPGRVGLTLAIAMIEAKRTDLASLSHAQSTYDDLLKSHKPGVALALTSIILKNGYSEEMKNRAVALYSELSSKTALEEGMVLPFMGPLLNRFYRVLDQRDVDYLNQNLRLLESQSKVDKSAAVIMLSAVFSLQGVRSTEPCIDQILKYYYDFLKHPVLNSTNAALLAAASLVSDPYGKMQVSKVIGLWDMFHNIPELSASMATSLAFRVLMSRNLDVVSDSMLMNPVGRVSSSSSDTGPDLFTLWFWSNAFSSNSASATTWADSPNASFVDSSSDTSSDSSSDSGGGGDGGGGE